MGLLGQRWGQQPPLLPHPPMTRKHTARFFVLSLNFIYRELCIYRLSAVACVSLSLRSKGLHIVGPAVLSCFIILVLYILFNTLQDWKKTSAVTKEVQSLKSCQTRLNLPRCAFLVSKTKICWTFIWNINCTIKDG